MALSNKIWLNEMTQKSADEIVEETWNTLKAHYRTFSNNAVGVMSNIKVVSVRSPLLKTGIKP